MNENMRRQIMGASAAVSAAPAEDEDARHDQNVEKASDAALQLFYDNDSHNELMSMIPDGDPMGGVAVVSADLIQAVDDKSGGNMPDDVIFPAAMDVMSEIIDFLSEKGIHTFTEKEMGLASILLMKKLADDYGTTPEQMKQALSDIDQGELERSDAVFKDQMITQEQNETPEQETAEISPDGDEQKGLLAQAKRG